MFEPTPGYRKDKSWAWNKIHGFLTKIPAWILRRQKKNQAPQPAPKPAPQPSPIPSPVPSPSNLPQSFFDSNGKPISVPAGTLVFVMHDGVGRNYNPSAGVYGDPETNKSLSDRFFGVTDNLEKQLQGVIELLNPGMKPTDFIGQFHSLYASNRAFSNKSGWNSGHFAIENLICGGATRRAVTGVPYRAAGEWWLDVYAIDVTKLPLMPTTAADIDMTLWFFPVVAMQTPTTAEFRANPFPQFDGRCVVPYLGKGGINAIRLAKLKPVDSIQNPFLPARNDIFPPK